MSVESVPSRTPALELPTEEFPIPRTISDVLRRIDYEEFQNHIRSFSYDPKSKKKVLKLGRNLIRTASSKRVAGIQSERTERFLQYLTPLFNEKYEVLVRKVEEWKSVRIPLIAKLENFIQRLDRNYKLCSAVRLLSSTADVTGSVGGLLMNPESDWAKYAFTAASVCGLCGLISTVLEVASTKRILDEVSESREEDYKLFESVVKWFDENQELDLAVQDLFPHGIDKEVALQIQEASIDLEEHMKVLQSALVSNARKDGDLLKNKDFLHSLQIFSRSDVASLWWNRIIFRQHPIHLDLNRMTLQMEFGQMQSLVFQSIPALPLEQQRLTSLPVAGRIMLNFLTMYDASSDLRHGAKSMYSDKLRKLLTVMKTELDIINDAVENMKPENGAVENLR